MADRILSGRPAAPRPLPSKVVYVWLDADTPTVELIQRLNRAGLELRTDYQGEWFLVAREVRS